MGPKLCDGVFWRLFWNHSWVKALFLHLPPTSTLSDIPPTTPQKNTHTLFLASIILFILAQEESAELAFGVGLLIFGFGLIGCGCCKEATLSLDSMYDERPFEAEGIASGSLPFSKFDATWNNLKRGWIMNSQTPIPKVKVTIIPAADSSPSSTVTVVNPSGIKDWAGAAPKNLETVTLGANSSMHITPEGFIEVKDRCCLVKKRSLTWSTRVKWVRLPCAYFFFSSFPLPYPKHQPVSHTHSRIFHVFLSTLSPLFSLALFNTASGCNCCSKIQIGTSGEESLSAPMEGIYASSVARVFQKLLLNRTSIAAQGATHKLSACAPARDCSCPKSTLVVDNDFIEITKQANMCTPGSVVLYRTEDLPWVYSEKSGTLWCKGITSIFVLILFGILTPILSFVILFSPLLILIAVIGSLVMLMLLNFVGYMHCGAIASLCCSFTVVTLGTPGSGSVDDQVTGCCGKTCTRADCRLILCLTCGIFSLCIPTKAAPKKIYNCEDRTGSNSKRFVANTRLNITAANHAAIRAQHECSGAEKEGVLVETIAATTAGGSTSFTSTSLIAAESRGEEEISLVNSVPTVVVKSI